MRLAADMSKQQMIARITEVGRGVPAAYNRKQALKCAQLLQLHATMPAITSALSQ
jgi:hypothetical protein